MGQNLSDTFYPDNPNRRRRADELKRDIEGFASTFKEIEARRDKILREIKEPLAKILAAQGYDSPEKLDAKVQSVLKGDHLKEYLDTKNRYDKNSELEKTIFSICSYVSIGAGVFLGGLALLSIITGGLALSLLGAVGVAIGFVAAAAALFAAIEGAKERANLRKAISNLAVHRLQVRRALFVMEAISSWLLYIRSYCRDVVKSGDVSDSFEMWEGDFEKDFAKSEHAATVKWLEDYDRERRSWTNEDGDWKRDPGPERKVLAGAKAQERVAVRVGIAADALEIMGPDVGVGVHGAAHAKEAVAKAILQRQESSERLTFTIDEVTKTGCRARDAKGEEWDLLPETIAPAGGQMDINSYVFSIQKLSDGMRLEHMKVVDFTSAP